jgi:hypothetical protein
LGNEWYLTDFPVLIKLLLQTATLVHLLHSKKYCRVK